MAPGSRADFAEYVTGIQFNRWQPDQPLRGVYGFVDRRRPGKLNLDFRNLDLPDGDPETRRRLARLKGFPRMSTMAIGAVLNRAVATMPQGQTYLNVGVWHGFTFLAGCVGNPDQSCVGVDNFSQYGGPREAFLERFERIRGPAHAFHDMDYLEYFDHVHKGQLGVYYYDGMHTYKDQFEALEVAEPYMAKGCIIGVDDTNGDDPRNATIDFMNARPGKYELLLDRTTVYSGHPTWWNGLMVLRKRD